jgi:hypothetical protein
MSVKICDPAARRAVGQPLLLQPVDAPVKQCGQERQLLHRGS